MTTQFGKRWIETEGQPFEFEGRLVHLSYRREIVPGTLIDIEFLSCRDQPPQGLTLSTKDAKLAWDEHGVEGQSVRLWADKQQLATLRYANPRKVAEITISNVWLDRLVSSQPPTVLRAWAWSGMQFEETADTVVLRCSGSYDGPNFTDLTARLSFRSVK